MEPSVVTHVPKRSGLDFPGYFFAPKQVAKLFNQKTFASQTSFRQQHCTYQHT
jgi:hypothetical protein